MKLEHRDVWTGMDEKTGLHFEVAHWGVGTAMNDGHGVWNFYVYIRENQTPRFEEIWIPDEIKQYSEGGRKYLNHDYMNCPLSSADWHCGITFYEKRNHELPGQRWVKAGCDYSHYYDQGKFDLYSLEYVADEAVRCCESLAEILQIPPPSPKP